MRKVLYTSLLLLFGVSTANAGAWVRQDIGGLASIEYPTVPVATDVRDRTDILLMTDSCYYLTKITKEARNYNIRDSVSLIRFYKGVATGILKGDKGRKTIESVEKIQDKHALALEYISSDINQRPIVISSMIVLVNGRLIVYSFSAPTSRFVFYTALRERFFHSFSLADADQLVQFNFNADTSTVASGIHTLPAPPAPDSASAAAVRSTHSELVKDNTLHFILSFAGSILGLAAILYLIVRWRKKSHAKQ